MAAPGFEVSAAENGDYLCALAAHNVFDCTQFAEAAWLLEAARRAATVDTVGSIGIRQGIVERQKSGYST